MLDFRGESFGRRCGRWAASSLSLPHHTIVSPYNITIEFHSDESHTYSGFEAKWTTLSPRSKYLDSLLLDEPHNLYTGSKTVYFHSNRLNFLLNVSDSENANQVRSIYALPYFNSIPIHSISRLSRTDQWNRWKDTRTSYFTRFSRSLYSPPRLSSHDFCQPWPSKTTFYSLNDLPKVMKSTHLIFVYCTIRVSQESALSSR